MEEIRNDPEYQKRSLKAWGSFVTWNKVKQRMEDIEYKIISGITPLNLGTAKVNVGPPVILNADETAKWMKELNETYFRLIRNIMIPALKEKEKAQTQMLVNNLIRLLQLAKHSKEVSLQILVDLFEKLKAKFRKDKKDGNRKDIKDRKISTPENKGIGWEKGRREKQRKSPLISEVIGWSNKSESRIKIEDRMDLEDEPVKKVRMHQATQTEGCLFGKGVVNQMTQTDDNTESKTLTKREEIRDNPKIKIDQNMNKKGGNTNLHSKVQVVKGDGNCLFRSLALGLGKEQKEHKEVREEICEYLRQNKEKFKAFFFPERILGTRIVPKTYEEYVAAMNTNAAYGGALEITAAAENWQVAIRVFNDDETLHSNWMENEKGKINIRYSEIKKHYDYIRQLGVVAKSQLNKENLRFLNDKSVIELSQTQPNESGKQLDAQEPRRLNNDSQADPFETHGREEEQKLIQKNMQCIREETPINMAYASEQEDNKERKLISETEIIDLTVSPTREMVKKLKGVERRKLLNYTRKYFSEQKVKRKQQKTRETLERELKHIYIDDIEKLYLGTSGKNGIEETDMRSSVFNFSGCKLNQGELGLLTKGLTFSPAQRNIEAAQLQVDIYNFCRRVRLQKFYETKYLEGVLTKKKTPNPLDKFKPESTFDPECTDKNLSSYLEEVRQGIELLAKKKQRTSDNLNQQERDGLNSLKDKIEKDLIRIVVADKGGGIVVVDTKTYKDKGDSYMKEEKDTYIKMEMYKEEIIKEIIKERSKVVEKLIKTKVLNSVHKKYINYNLKPVITGIKFFYKIHKADKIEDIPLRPIHPSINSPNHQLSMILDAILKPFVNQANIPTYLRDTNQLLHYARTEDLNTLDPILVTSDVTSLYTNIPHKLGVSVLKKFLNRTSTYTQGQIEEIGDAVHHVVSLNYLVWEGAIYKQIRGVAMGTPLAVNYANIFMSEIDECIKERAPYITKHFRFIDDNLFILPRDKITELQETCRDIPYKTIKFTWNVDKGNYGVAFLDAWLKIKDNRLHTRLYTKQTDKHLYLHPKSSHPRHIIRNIPYATFTRIKRLCMDETEYREDKNKAIKWLYHRGYQMECILDAVRKADEVSGMELIQKIETRYGGTPQKTPGDDKVILYNTDHKRDQNIIPLILTYNRKLRKAPQVLYKYRKGLEAVLSQPHRPLVAFRRIKNLKDILVHTSYNKHTKLKGKETEKKEGFRQCKKKMAYKLKKCIYGKQHTEGCRMCAHSIDNMNRLPKTTVKILKNQEATCHTANVVYAIWCKVCYKIYIGETRQTLAQRFDQHLRIMRKGDSKEEVYTHFKSHNMQNAYVTPLEVVKRGNNKLLQVKESVWINRLQTLAPRGLNTKLDLNQRYIGAITPRKNKMTTPTPARIKEKLLEVESFKDLTDGTIEEEEGALELEPTKRKKRKTHTPIRGANLNQINEDQLPIVIITPREGESGHLKHRTQ